MGLNELREFERRIDAHVQALPIWQLPIRCVLLSLHMALHAFFSRDALTGFNVAARAAHLLPFLARCPSEPTGANALNAFHVYEDVDPAAQNMILALNYGHFCEIMPEVHRGYYDVALIAEKHFRLTHHSVEFGACEAKDIILSELSLAHVTAARPDVRAEIEALARTAPHADLELMSRVQGTYIHHYIHNIAEPPLVPDAALMAAVGVTSPEFARFRAALLAMSDFALDLANAIEPRVRFAGPGGPEESEWLEWISVFWKDDFLRHMLQGLAGITEASVNRLLATFSLDFRTHPPSLRHGGDGYFPPLALLPDGGILFGPHLVRLFLQSRNVLYALQRLDRARFDNIVSAHLEPQLLQTAAGMLRGIAGVEVVLNVQWQEGEMDLLGFQAATHTALHVQAKGALPPQGARSVARLEDRVREGIDQILRFRELTPERVDQIVSRALGRELHGVQVVDALLARSCFGTHRVWAQGGDVSFVSLPILSELTRAGEATGITNLADFPNQARLVTDQYVAQARPAWVYKTLTLSDVSIDVPMLDYDHRFVESERRRIWAGHPVI